MTYDIQALLDLWTEPHHDLVDAEQAFRRLYTDPVVVNGAPIGRAPPSRNLGTNPLTRSAADSSQC